MFRVLVVDDDTNLRFAFHRILEPERYEIVEASTGEEALKDMAPGRYSVIFLDQRMPGLSGMDTLTRIRAIDSKVPVIMITAYGGTEEAIESVQRGAYDFVLKPFEVDHIRRLAWQAVDAHRLMTRPVQVAEEEESAAADSDSIVGRSRSMQEVYKQIGRVAASDATVLILGDSGTGKELVARAIYHHSSRSNKPFLAVNCAAIPEGLLESDLFGHEKGAFTSAAHRRLGKFERAQGGTLFLDEIGDMTPHLQAKILRVLQEGNIERVGGSETIPVDVRILAATNRDLRRLIEEEKFREDLYFRLNVFTIRLPSLSERLEDLPLLVQYCLRRGNGRLGKHVSQVPDETMAKLKRHTWRGNVRELENVIDRALIVTTGETLLPESITFDEHSAASGEAAEPGLERLFDLVFERLAETHRQEGTTILSTLEQAMIERALRALDHNQVQAARLLGLSRQTLRKRLQAPGEGESDRPTEAPDSE